MQAIYDGLVRIWRREGWSGVTTRSLALETGYAVGTLYEYFPNREALLSGYVRHAMESLLARIAAEAGPGRDLSSRQRVSLLVRLTCGVGPPDLPFLDSEMLALEHRIAEQKHHRRVYEELCEAWSAALSACADLQRPPEAAGVEALVTAVWGARRYMLLVLPEGFNESAWAEQIEEMIWAALN